MGRKYVYRPGHPKASERGFVAYEDLFGDEPQWTHKQVARADVSYMDGLRAVDGTDISSKKKRRDYMRAMGVTDSSDFSPAYYERVRKDAQREDYRERREAIGRAAYEVLDRRK